MATLTYFGFGSSAGTSTVPQGTLAQRPDATPANEGAQYFATDDISGGPDGTLWLSVNSDWVQLNGGAEGIDLLFGTGAPDNSLGTNTQYYLDKLAVNLYGPKASGVWPADKILLGALRENTGQVWIDIDNLQLNLADAASDLIALQAYVDALSQGFTSKQSVRLATAAALPTNTYSSGVLTAVGNGALTVDGTAVAVGNRILVKNEVAALKNGIYVVTAAGAGGAPYVLTRSSDMNANTEIEGAYVFVESGTANDNLGYQVADEGPYTLGTTAINWNLFSGAGQINVTGPIQKSGNTLSLAALVNADISASAAIAKSKLAALNIVNADVDAAAAIAKSKLANLDVVDADVNASAAIAQTKIATLVADLAAKKPLVQRTNTITVSSNTYTPNCDTTDESLIVTPAANFTVAAPTGTPNDGQRLVIRIRSDATGRTPTWNAIYEASGVAAPFTTALPASKTVTFFYKYDLNATKWKCMAADTVGY